MPSILDEKDAKILEILQKDGRASNVELARAVELTPSALLDPHALGLGLVAFIFLRVDDPEDLIGRAEGTARELAALPSVLELHHLAGEDCFLVKVRARDTDDLYRILRDELGPFKQIKSTRTTIVLKTVKETVRFP